MKLDGVLISDKPDKKFYARFINGDKEKRVYFGSSLHEHYTEGHLDEKRKMNYINRHRKNENWKNPLTAGFWSRWMLWEFRTYDEAFKFILQQL